MRWKGITQTHAFILPGGSPAGAMLHLARGICRRAERRVDSLTSSGRCQRGCLYLSESIVGLSIVCSRYVNHKLGNIPKLYGSTTKQSPSKGLKTDWRPISQARGSEIGSQSS